jgi:hypothetical protein
MGLKRSFDRKRERERAELVRRRTLPVSANIHATCDVCGRKLILAVPRVPKRGTALRLTRACECGREVTLVLTGSAPPNP